MRLFRMGLVAALTALCACDGGDDGDGDNTDGDVCTGTVSGATTGKIVFCTLEAQRISEDNLTYTYKFDIEWESGASGQGIVSLQGTGDPQKGTFTASDFTTVLGDITLEGGETCHLSAGQNQDRGSISMTVESIPEPQDFSGFTTWEWFGGKVQATFAPVDIGNDCPGEVSITSDFVPQP